MQAKRLELFFVWSAVVSNIKLHVYMKIHSMYRSPDLLNRPHALLNRSRTLLTLY